jgi:hypothetical protein
MKRRTLETTRATDGVLISLRNGNIVTLPRKTLRREGKEPITVTDFSSVDPCPRCDTTPKPDGTLPSSGGILRPYAIHSGIWTAYAAACDCVFGAWRTIERRTEEGMIPPMRYADDIPGIPPGLSTADWTLLHLYKQDGDDYWQAVCRIPETSERGPELRRWIENWEHRTGQEVSV